MTAINAISHDSAKVLSEKLALSREVAVLKPELEHLRSQLAHQTDVLAEKLALERQLNTLEVELANEKRAAQKNLKSQENKTSEADGELQALREQLATMEKSLAAEKRRVEQLTRSQTNATKAQEELEQLRQSLEEAEKALVDEKRAAKRQAKLSAADEELEQLREELAEAREALAEEKRAQEKLRKENEQAQIDAEERQQAAGDKVERLRGKLRETQEELKRCKAELEKAQERTVKISSGVSTTTIPVKGIGAKANAKKKRPADEMSVDDKVLLTPGNTDDRPKRPLKKRGFDLSMVGGKSEFSITPFLNKTVNLDASPKPSAEDATPSAPVQFRGAEEPTTTTTTEPTTEESAAPQSSAVKPATTKLVEKRPRGRPRKEPLSDSSPSKKNLTARNRKAPRVEPTLEKVAEEQEEGDSTNQDQENRSTTSTTTATTKTATTAPTTTAASTLTNFSIPEKAEPKKKKRKLLGANASTLFDGGEDEGERVNPVAASVSATGAAGAVKRPAVKVGGMKAMGKGPVVARIGGVKNAFAGASFSPLKRDRRGVAASFLA